MIGEFVTQNAHEAFPDQNVAEFTHSALDPAEFELATAIVNWRGVNRYEELIHTVHGRSIVFKSPSRPKASPDDLVDGKYDGLQIIGAGGSMQALQDGLVPSDQPFQILPVDESNGADILSDIIQLRAINKNGQLVYWQRPYAPLRGMDVGEAENRRSATVKLSDDLLAIRNSGLRPPIIVPTFAAEGFFPDKLGPDGHPLRFQVYRVPLLPRLPGQLINTASEEDFQAASRQLLEASEVMGRALRSLHEAGTIYLDGHIGNISYIPSPNQETLYITDLGSMINCKGNEFFDRYRGLDVFMYLESVYRLMRSVHSELQLSDTSLVRNFLQNASLGLVSGYFTRELPINSIDEEASASSIGSIRTLALQTLYHLLKSPDPQEFIEFFEQKFQTLHSPSQSAKSEH